MPDEDLRERAASALAAAIIEELIGTPCPDVNQLALPLDVKPEGERAPQ